MLHYPKLHQSACWIETSTHASQRQRFATPPQPPRHLNSCIHCYCTSILPDIHPHSFRFFYFQKRKKTRKKNRSSTAQPTKSCRVTTLKMPSAASNKDTTLTSPSMLAQGNWIFTPLELGMIVQCTKRVRLQGGSGVHKCYHLDFHLDPTDPTRS